MMCLSSKIHTTVYYCHHVDNRSNALHIIMFLVYLYVGEILSSLF